MGFPFDSYFHTRIVKALCRIHVRHEVFSFHRLKTVPRIYGIQAICLSIEHLLPKRSDCFRGKIAYWVYPSNHFVLMSICPKSQKPMSDRNIENKGLQVR